MGGSVLPDGEGREIARLVIDENWLSVGVAFREGAFSRGLRTFRQRALEIKVSVPSAIVTRMSCPGSCRTLEHSFALDTEEHP
jgi:hypothetical protein